MAQTTITITIDTPADMTIAEAVRLFTDNKGYSVKSLNPLNPGTFINNGTRTSFAKKVVANFVKDAILEQQKIEAQASIVIKDVQVN